MEYELVPLNYPSPGSGILRILHRSSHASMELLVSTLFMVKKNGCNSLQSLLVLFGGCKKLSKPASAKHAQVGYGGCGLFVI